MVAIHLLCDLIVASLGSYLKQMNICGISVTYVQRSETILVVETEPQRGKTNDKQDEKKLL